MQVSFAGEKNSGEKRVNDIKLASMLILTDIIGLDKQNF